MRVKYKLAIVGIAVTLVLGLVLLSTTPHVEVYGIFSQPDVAWLAQSGRAENSHAITDWSPTPTPGSLVDIIRKLKRAAWVDSIRIDRVSEEQASVTIRARRLIGRDSEREYLFVRTKQGWKLVRPGFE